MDSIVKFFGWISNGLSQAVSFIVSLPGILLTSFTAGITAILSIFNLLDDFTIIPLVNEFQTIISSFSVEAANFPLLSLLSEMCALDTAFTYCSTLFGFFCTVILFFYGTLVVSLFTLYGLVMSARGIQKVIRLLVPVIHG